MIKGSSETTREALNFNFFEYAIIKPDHIKKIDISFLEWFIGFTEGNGRFIITKQKPNRIFFCINQQDGQLLFKIKKNLDLVKLVNIIKTILIITDIRFMILKTLLV